uniref:Uncharacterized protein n=1 Tax=Anguilla anguilla TaxID=7936 RepID=A0A0E9RUW5_ANGAN
MGQNSAFRTMYFIAHVTKNIYTVEKSFIFSRRQCLIWMLYSHFRRK